MSPARTRSGMRSSRPARPGCASTGTPHVAQVMVNHGYVRSVREAFDRYLRAGGPAVPVVDHDLGDVGPSRGAFLHERQDLGGVDGHAELGEPLRHTVDTLPALRALLGEEVLKPPGLPIHAV